MIDKSQSKDHVQDLMDKYKRICREEGVRGHHDMHEAMGNLATKGIHTTVDQRAWAIAVQSHKFAGDILDQPEFFALKQWWAMQFNSTEREWAGNRLLDMGALEYSRGLISGYTNT